MLAGGSWLTDQRSELSCCTAGLRDLRRCCLKACTTPATVPSYACACAEIGLGLTGFGIFFTILGMLMLFDKGLIAMGNVRVWVAHMVHDSVCSVAHLRVAVRLC
jgi:hypothetical protein